MPSPILLLFQLHTVQLNFLYAALRFDRIPSHAPKFIIKPTVATIELKEVSSHI